MPNTDCTECGEPPKLFDERYTSLSVASSFVNIKDYFSADILVCNQCASTWLYGYYEDFDDRPIEAEWGDRVWIWRPLTTGQIDEIVEASGTRRLDLTTFATG